MLLSQKLPGRLAVMEIKYSQDIIDVLRMQNVSIMELGTFLANETPTDVPELFYLEHGHGREGVIIVIKETAMQVAETVVQIANMVL